MLNITNHLSIAASENLHKDLDNEEVAKLYISGGCDFKQVLLRYNNLVLSVAQTWIPNYSFEDRYQELTIRMFKALQKWNPEKAKFSTYLSIALANQVKWMYRKENTDMKKANNDNNPSYESLMDLGIDSAVTEDGELVQWKIDESEEYRRFIEIIDGVDLKPNERICVELIYEGAKKKDIAAILGLTSSSVSNIFKGLRPKFTFLLSKNYCY